MSWQHGSTELKLACGRREESKSRMCRAGAVRWEGNSRVLRGKRPSEVVGDWTLLLWGLDTSLPVLERLVEAGADLEAKHGGGLVTRSRDIRQA